MTEVKIKRGQSIFVGDWVCSDNCGRCQVIQYNNSKDVLVRFENSGVEKSFSRAQLKAGTISDKIFKVIFVGDVFETNLSGPATVLKMLPKSKILIQFEDGNTKIVGRSLLQGGSVYNGSWNYTQEEAIQLMADKHNGFYKYNKVIFKTVKDKIIVSCPIHDDFETSFDNHYNAGCGCFDCGVARRAAKKTIPWDIVFEDLKRCHGELYKYNKDTYVNNETKMEIVCEHHGSFWQSPEKHKTGQHCPECSGNTVMTTEKFMAVLPDKHLIKYSYKLVTDEHFIHESKIIPIICPDHDVFHQHYRNHLSGSGCRECAIFGFKVANPAHLYILRSEDEVKVGITNNAPTIRVKQIEVSSGKKFEIIKIYSDIGYKCLDVETLVLKTLREKYNNPTNYFSGSTECFIDASTECVIDLVEVEWSNYEKERTN